MGKCERVYIWIEKDSPVQTQSVKEGGETLHENQHPNGEASPGGEDKEEHN